MPASDPVDDVTRDLRREHRLTPADGPDALLEAEALDVLDDVAARSSLEALLDELDVRVRGQDHHRDSGMGAAQPAANLYAADIGEARVEQNHVRPARLDELGHNLAKSGLTNHLEVRLRAEHRHQSLANHLVVVHDQDTDSRAHATATGMRTRIASPLSSPLRTSNVPPRSST